MKTAVSIPDPIFQDAERLARTSRISRSQLYSQALKEYIARHSSDTITEAMNRVCDEIGDTRDPFVARAAERILRQSEW